MGKYQAYPEYRETRHDLLPPIPVHWMTGQIKNAHDVVLGKMLQSDAKTPADRLLPYLRAANVNWGGVDLSTVKEMWFSPAERKALRLMVGDVVISEGGDVGRSAVWQGELPECYFQNAINRARPKGEHSSRYLYYWMSFIKSAGYIDIICNKSTIPHYTAEKVQGTPFLFPPAGEQAGIAAFLDHETAKIDRLIAKQQRLIELLKEKRQAVISHAVTKGLNPDAPMKDSGVEWLGEVPAHWRLEKLKYTAIFKGGGTPSKDSPEYWGGDIPWVSPKDMKSRYVADSQDKITVEAIAASSTSLIGPGQVLVVVRSGILQRTIPVAVNLVEVTLNQDMKAIDFRDETRSEFFSYFVEGHEDNLLLEWRKQGATVESIEQEYLGNTMVPMPPPSEMMEILQFLNGQLEKYRLLTEKATRAIELLREHRTALISAAVTGKIDVRGWQKPNTEPQEAAEAASA
ncbi:type I restriction-modification system, S subunit [Thioalkalivibrio sulfidiphilus HL-EbGr7]|uniref:Type I restriction-modification system, S subunit n=1 Tax=Thioalkalivibrio sulfidiphilus (strain HL-EbGR7) TaxID=396588 RepID=B8GLU3_THISH|nr:restriction endonuclease subunit S [Thioalkalivibrio sulfidiphilus]ACL71696.1 type I restriction-modification system, S subunit [Thioalkalivibrio sulfidiphilus HL-EbGr7]